MKLIILLLCVGTLNFCDSKGDSWSPRNIVEAFTNRTGRLTHYVKEKAHNVSSQINNIYNEVKHVNYEIKDYIYDKQKKMTEKFKKIIVRTTETGKAMDTNPFVSSDTNPFVSSDPNDCKNDDPQITMTTPQLIVYHGYPAEAHTIKTDDGYLLTVHRIPHSKYTKKQTTMKTVLMHHGLLGCSADWVIAGPNKSLAYILADAGYDVWLANVRGNTYSKAHVSRKTDSYEFWNFTWHDVSQHDLPAVIDYITDLKGQDVKINYIGHSMGTTVLFALLSTKPEYNKKLRAGFALAPVAYMTHIRSPIRLLAPLSNKLELFMKLVGANEFLPQNGVLRWLSEHACEINHYEEAICENTFFVICGYDGKQFNMSLLPIILGHMPAGASTKSLIHYSQEIYNDGKFQQFDFGKEGNIKEYGQEIPPEYPLEDITLPIALLSAQNDWLSSLVDVDRLYKKLANPIENYVVPLPEFNHLDFLWAVDAPKLVYKKLLMLIEKGSA